MFRVVGTDIGFTSVSFTVKGTTASASVGLVVSDVSDNEQEALLGDVCGDGEETVLDATYIQRHVVGIPIPFVLDETIADTDGDGDVIIMDATYIQRWLILLKSNDSIGKPIR